MIRRILILMSDTGGGHRAAANAICEAIHTLYPGQFEIIIEDIWRNQSHWPIRQMPTAYPWLAGPGVRWWRLFWALTSRPRIRQSMFTSAALMTGRRMGRYLHQIQPDIVVSVHPAMNHLGVRWLHQKWPHVPFYTVITDMVTVHPAWVCPDVTGCLVSTEPARQMAIANGMPPQKVQICGQPISLKFVHFQGEKVALRQQLDLPTNRPAALLMGGGEGIGRVYDIARAIAQQVDQAQLLIVAGRNKELKAQLEATAWEIPTRIYGFVDFVPELMGAADVLITKAGPGTLSEAFVVGLPVIISGYIPGQEEGNVHYVRQNQAGVYEEDPQAIAQLIANWFGRESRVLAQMAGQSARLARPEAALEIARVLCR